MNGYGFQTAAMPAPPHPEAVRPYGQSTSLDTAGHPAAVRFRDHRRRLWEEEARQESLRQTVEALEDVLPQRARSGALGCVELTLVTRADGSVICTRIRFPDQLRMMTIEEALESGRLTSGGFIAPQYR